MDYFRPPPCIMLQGYEFAYGIQYYVRLYVSMTMSIGSRPNIFKAGYVGKHLSSLLSAERSIAYCSIIHPQHSALKMEK